uniref:Uncharacterized protein n=1 Tax=Romanomermis culicivorax TaxID=13658 RepID=A0A915L5T3_ROMCU
MPIGQVLLTIIFMKFAVLVSSHDPISSSPVREISHYAYPRSYPFYKNVPQRTAKVKYHKLGHTSRGQRPHERQIGSRCLNDSSVIARLEKNGYNKHKIPRQGRQPVVVDIEMWIQEISSIAALTSDFNVDIYISEMWRDPGLAFAHFNPCKKNVTLTDDILQRIWRPNTCFINSKTADLDYSPFFAPGPCTMNLKAFPLDYITCSLTFESFNYNNEEVHMKWADNEPVKIFVDLKHRRHQTFLPFNQFASKPILNLADFVLINISATAVVYKYPAGFWDELSISFLFRRCAGWYILQAYLPTYLTIFISWISFYLGAGIAARTLLGVNTLLALTFQFGNIISNLPRVSYVKAIDVWMLTAQTFVFCSLLELAFIGYLCRTDINKNQRKISGAARGAIAVSSKFGARRFSDPSLTLMPRRSAIDNSRASMNDEGSGDADHSENIRISSNEPQSLSKMEDQCRHRWVVTLGDPEGKGDGLLATSLLPQPQSRPSPDVEERDFWTVENIDRISSVIFPLAFLIFNIIYWWYYTWWIKFESDYIVQ